MTWVILNVQSAADSHWCDSGAPTSIRTPGDCKLQDPTPEFLTLLMWDKAENLTTFLSNKFPSGIFPADPGLEEAGQHTKRSSTVDQCGRHQLHVTSGMGRGQPKHPPQLRSPRLGSLCGRIWFLHSMDLSRSSNVLCYSTESFPQQNYMHL